MSIELKDKLYTSTQVADILGVSLRTLYRYMEDNKIQSMRTASGRHRFTKDHILDFLNAGAVISHEDKGPFVAPVSVEQKKPQEHEFYSKVTTAGFSPQAQARRPWINDTVDLPVQPQPQPQPQQKPFSPNEQRGARETGNLQSVWNQPQTPVRGPDSFVVHQPIENKQTEFDQSEQSIAEKSLLIEATPIETPVDAVDLTDVNIRYYKSDYIDLIELAKKINDTALTKDLEYAFTLFAGLSLHFLVKPFTKLHIYANPEDMQIWKDELRLIPVQKKEDANIGIIINTDIVFVPTKVVGGFKVVDDKVLMRDLARRNEEELVKQFRQHLTSS